LTTIVHPAAIAGPILRVPAASGKSHWVINTQDPTGCFKRQHSSEPQDGSLTLSATGPCDNAGNCQTLEDAVDSASRQ
jgi:hypothetical protein